MNISPNVRFFPSPAVGGGGGIGISGTSSSSEEGAASAGRGATILGPGMTGGIMVCCVMTRGAEGTGTSGITIGRSATRGEDVLSVDPPKALILSESVTIPFER